MREMEWMAKLSDDISRPVSFTLIQASHAPELWRQQLDRAEKAHENGIELYAQFAARPFGMLLGFPGYHAFTHRPTFRRLKAELGREELSQRLTDPAVKAAILAEEDVAPAPGVLLDGLFALAQYSADRLYAIGDPPDYEPTQDMTVAAIAAARGQDPLSTMYDLMLESDAGAMLMLPFFNYAEGDHSAIYEMMQSPAAVSGLSDGGAHCGLICDASYPTFLLTHWARDRHRGPKFSLEYVIRKQTLDTATLFGLSDRGVIQVGKRADLNVIDMEALTLDSPRMVYDLPAGGRRLIQGASGYDATVVNGMVTRRHGVDTGARPGRLLRGVR
jgi:N-acyl-D-aspartate/D-glutamate deacylase